MNFSVIDSRLNEMIGETETGVLGLGVIVFKDGREVFSKFLGRRKVDPDLPVTRDTRFRVASISKMFTMFSILQLGIDLDSDISDYLGFRLRNPNFPDEKITVRMLASHTSSLRDGKIYSIPPRFSVREFFDSDGRFFDGGIHFGREKLGEFFCYCNLNYGLLGTIIEKISGERFDLYQKNHILKQLETRADYIVGNLEDFDKLGSLYQKNLEGEWTAQIDDYSSKLPRDLVLIQNPYSRETDGFYSLEDYEIGSNATIFSPAGGLRISFDELSHCLEMLMNRGSFRGRQILEPSSIEEMMKSQWIFNGANGDPSGVMFNYGLGMYRIDGNSAARLCESRLIDFVGHSGEAYGMISGLYLIPNERSGVIFMINGEAIVAGEDPKSLGRFSNSFIWEENLMDSICEIF